MADNIWHDNDFLNGLPIILNLGNLVIREHLIIEKNHSRRQSL